MQKPFKGFFITGTDTDIGKTVATAALTAILRHGGRRVLPVKPVQTGCAADPRRPAPDIAVCLKLSGLRPPADSLPLLTTYRFPDACSPHLAAARAGEVIRLPRILAAIRRLNTQADLLLVEGAGGICVPLNRRATMLDLMQSLGMPVIIVARAQLGTINHTLLTVQALRQAGVKIAGIIFNTTACGGRDYIIRDNLRIIPRLARLPGLGCLPYMRDLPGCTTAGFLRHARAALPSADFLDELAGRRS